MAEEKPNGAAAVTADQLGVNIAHYEKVYGECLAAADRIAAGRTMDEETKLRIAESLFMRFFDDQVALSKVQAEDDRLRPFLAGIQRALERRGLLA